MNSRRIFLIGAGAAGVFGTSHVLHDGAQAQEGRASDAKNQENAKEAANNDKPSQLDSKLVNRFVGQSHGNINGVQAMLKKEPMLANAAWDWKEGDWETGLNAASHVGNREIAELLLEHGARLDVCAAVMLGMDGVIKAMQSVNPKLHAVRGAHQIPLLHHAIFGGEKADGVLELLLEGGADVDITSNSGMTPIMAAASSGRVDIVEMFVRKGANVSAKNKKDQTALEMVKARKSKSDEAGKNTDKLTAVVKYLESVSQ